MAVIWCMLFHRRHWSSHISIYYGVPQFDEAERCEWRTCGRCGRSC